MFAKSFQRGFGTFSFVNEPGMQIISEALAVGYRHFDTAQLYENEDVLGEVIAHSDVARDELMITTKVMTDNMASEQLFMSSVEQSLQRLRLTEVDLLLLHWPPPRGKLAATLQLLERTQQQGLARHIGVSNFTAAMMHEACTTSETPLVCNQVEFHPLLDQRILLTAAAETGIPLAAHCPLARGEVFNQPELKEIAANHDKDIAQITLRWILQQDVATITSSSKRSNMERNFALLDFELARDDLARITQLTATGHRCITKKPFADTPEWD